VIYESRPNVTADVAALCLKAADACILKGGKEAIHSNAAIADVLATAFRDAGIHENALQLVRRTDRETTAELLKRDDAIDVIVRGVRVSYVRSRRISVPVIKHYEACAMSTLTRPRTSAWRGNRTTRVQRSRCMQRDGKPGPSQHRRGVPRDLGPRLAGGDRASRRPLSAASATPSATEADWGTEYLDLILAVKIVDSLDGRRVHQSLVRSFRFHRHRHATTAERFLARVDSAVVYHNASSLPGGFEFGFGAEVGISQSNPRAGPMGLRELTTYKYVVRGEASR
jgi:glutamate-5-semialdehyde dehydrogenase